MKLLTKEIKRKAEKQYLGGSSLDSQNVVAKFFHPTGSWTWYLMNLDPRDNSYAWGIVKGYEIEMGSFSMTELQEYRGRFGLGIERDLYFRPMPAREVWDKLNRGEHI